MATPAKLQRNAQAYIKLKGEAPQVLGLPRWPAYGVSLGWEGERDGSDNPAGLELFLNKWHSDGTFGYKDGSYWLETIAMLAKVSDTLSEYIYGFKVAHVMLRITFESNEWSARLIVQSEKTPRVFLSLPATSKEHAEALREQLMAFVAQYPVMDLDIWTLYAEEVGGKIEWD